MAEYSTRRVSLVVRAEWGGIWRLFRIWRNVPLAEYNGNLLFARVNRRVGDEMNSRVAVLPKLWLQN